MLTPSSRARTHSCIHSFHKHLWRAPDPAATEATKTLPWGGVREWGAMHSLF